MNLLATETVSQLTFASNIILFVALVGTIVLIFMSFFRKEVSVINKVSTGFLILVIGFAVCGVLATSLPEELVEVEIKDDLEQVEEVEETVDYEVILFELGFVKYTDMYIFEIGNESIIFSTMSGVDGVVYESFSWTTDTIWGYYPNQELGYIDNPNQDDVCEYDLENSIYLSTQTCSEYELEALTYMYRGFDRLLEDFNITKDDFDSLIENVLNQE